MHPDSSLYIAGHQGLIGSAFTALMQARGHRNLILRRRAELDLADPAAVEHFFATTRPEYVLLAAGRTGGIIANRTYPADLMQENLAIQSNVIGAAHRHGVKRLIFFASSCMYPREAAQPMPETALYGGPLESTSQAYAVAKLAGVELCLALNRQHGETRFIPVIPNSVYGPRDNFDLDNSHVMAALIRRFTEAAARGADSVTLWGSGTPRREFVFSEDLADACRALFTGPLDTLSLPVNIGPGEDIAIRDLASLIAELSGFTGQIAWDTTKPDGTPRKLLDSSNLANWGWRPETPLATGLEKTIQWYLQSVR